MVKATEWVQANEGTQDIFLEELDVLLKRRVINGK